MTKLAVFAVLAAAAAPAAAAPPKAVTKDDRAKIEKAVQAALPPVDKAASAKCQVFVDAYNKDPEHATDQVAPAARCYRAAGALGAAIQMWNIVVKYLPSKPVASEATRELGAAYEASAMFDRAADKYEEFAKKYAGELEAPRLIVRAACIRFQLGDAAKADADLAFARQAFKKTTIAPRETVCDTVHPIEMPATSP